MENGSNGREADGACPHGVCVVGCPRSGTGYTSRVFRAAGFEVGHESLRGFGTSDYGRVVRRIPSSVGVLHQVRHPLNCMTSMQTILESSFQWLVRCIAITGARFDPERRTETCARIWLLYNAQCEAVADVTFRVESEDEWNRACETVGLPWIDRTGVPTDANTRRGQPVHDPWYDLPITLERIAEEAGPRLRQAIERMAKRYGYEL